MAYRFFDFDCPHCGPFEEMIAGDEKNLPCPSCGKDSTRMLAAPRADWRHMGLDPGFPGAYAKWGKEQTKHHKYGKDSMHKGKGNNLLMY